MGISHLVLVYNAGPLARDRSAAGRKTHSIRPCGHREEPGNSNRAPHEVQPPLWQRGFYDRVLRADENPEQIAAYTVANPVRKGLIKEGESWPWAYLDPQAI